jgi:phosphoglycerate kinase
MMAKVLSDGTADTVLTTGITANIMLIAQGIKLGAASTSFIADRGLDSFVPTAEQWLIEYGERIQVPVDLAFADGETRHEVAVTDLPIDDLLIDIGSRTASTYADLINSAETIFVNGPAGMYESAPGELGTRTLWEAVAAAPGYSVIGGGDTVASARRFVDVSQIGFISTGGGALVRFLSGQKLPLLEAMQRAAARQATT